MLVIDCFDLVVFAVTLTVVWLLVFVLSRSVESAFHLWFGYYCLFCPEVWTSFPPVVWLLIFCPEVWASFPPVVWLFIFCPEVWASFPPVIWLLIFCPEVWASCPPVVWLLVFVLSRSVGQLSTCGLVTCVCSVQKCRPAFHLWFGYLCLFCQEVWASFSPVVWLLMFCPEVWTSFPSVVWLLVFVLSRSVGQLSTCGMVTSVLNWHRVEEFYA